MTLPLLGRIPHSGPGLGLDGRTPTLGNGRVRDVPKEGDLMDLIDGTTEDTKVWDVDFDCRHLGIIFVSR